MTETPQEAFARGSVAGEINARLAGHDEHFKAINGSIERLATSMEGVRLELQRNNDAQLARDATVVTTAAALEAARKTRQEQSEHVWAVPARIYAFLGAIGIVIAIYFKWKTG